MSVSVTVPWGKVHSFGDLQTHFSNGNVAGVTDFLNKRTNSHPDDIVKFRIIIAGALLSLPHEEAMSIVENMVNSQTENTPARRAWECVWFDVAIRALTEA